MRRRRFISLLGTAGALLALKTAAARAISPKMTVLTAPLELGGDWGGSAHTDAAAVIKRMRAACLAGVPLLSDRQPEARVLGGCRTRQPRSRRVMIARHAAAGDMALGEGHLRVSHARLGGAGEPGGGLALVPGNAAALGKHAAVPVLRVHHAFRGALEPEGGARVITRHADALRQADREVERADEVALLGRTLEPVMDGRGIVREGGDRSALQEGREIGLRIAIAGLGGQLEPGRGLVRVPGNAGAGEVEHAQRPRRSLVPHSAAARNQCVASA